MEEKQVSEKQTANNRKRNIVAYVFAGLTLPGLALGLYLMYEGFNLINQSKDAAALIAAFICIFIWALAFLAFFGTFACGVVSVVILSLCIKRTPQTRKTVNLVILSIECLILLAGLILFIYSIVS